MMAVAHFQFCPKCGVKQKGESKDLIFQCDECDFTYYFNPATAAVGLLIAEDGKALFIRRAKDPAKGKLAMPGGFVDPGESGETALRRELQEELNLQVGPLEYLCSEPNVYPYKEITYMVIDLIFTARISSSAPMEALDDVESYCWLKPTEVQPDEIAFVSMRNALQIYLKRALEK